MMEIESFLLNGKKMVFPPFEDYLEYLHLTSCESLGLHEDDALGNNAALLVTAINSGSRILVDKMYTIKADAPAQISRDVVMIGKNESCGFNFTVSAQHYLLNITSAVNKISVENLILQNATGDVYSLLWNTSSGDNDLDLDELSVSGCSFKDVSLIRVSGNRLYNDSDTISRCDRFVFSNNKVENARFSFCQMADTLFKTAEIKSNTVHNFKWTLFSFSISNLPDSATEHEQQWEIVDNVIDCYYLGMYTANMPATQWTITGNNFSCVRLTDRLIPGNVAEKCTVNYKNNHIHVSGQSEFNLMTAPSPYVEYNVADNIIDAPSSTFTGMTGIEQTNGKEKFEGNKVVCNYARYQIAFGENDIIAKSIKNMGNFWANTKMNLFLKGETTASTVADFKLPEDDFCGRIRIIAMATGTTDIINKDYLVAIKKTDTGTAAKVYDMLTNTVAYDGLLRPTDASAWIQFGNTAAGGYIAMLKSTSSNKSHIGIESKDGVEAKISITTEVIDTLVSS